MVQLSASFYRQPAIIQEEFTAYITYTTFRHGKASHNKTILPIEGIHLKSFSTSTIYWVNCTSISFLDNPCSIFNLGTIFQLLIFPSFSHKSIFLYLRSLPSGSLPHRQSYMIHSILILFKPLQIVTLSNSAITDCPIHSSPSIFTSLLYPFTYSVSDLSSLPRMVLTESYTTFSRSTSLYLLMERS